MEHLTINKLRRQKALLKERNSYFVAEGKVLGLGLLKSEHDLDGFFHQSHCLWVKLIDFGGESRFVNGSTLIKHDLRKLDDQL